MSKLLEVKNLHVEFNTYIGKIQAVRGISFEVNKGEVVAIVGESGCGKSVTAQSILRLLPETTASIPKGDIFFDGRDILKMNQSEIQDLRGNEISMIFQDPMTSLNPTMPVVKQIMEGLRIHQNMNRSEARKKAISMLELVGIPHASKRADNYPHEFSGGMRQRVMIAIALACNPKLLIADEPTTALDVTIQAQILDLMRGLQEKTDTSIILITHDLGIVAQMCDRIVVMYAGQVVESGTTDEIFYTPQHPYTKGLLKSVPCPPFDDKPLSPIPGTPPDLFSPPKGCAYCARCDYAMSICKDYAPMYNQVKEEHFSRCWLQDQQAKQQKQSFDQDIPIKYEDAS
jgi:oligopeptide transport system ATP-binding protein